MYIDTAKSKRGDKTYTRHLLRTSYREAGKVKHKTIANLGQCSQEEIAAMKLALKHKQDLSKLGPLSSIELKQGNRFGAVWLIKQVADRLGISKALGSDDQGVLALWQICARIIDQGSRLSAVRLSKSHAALELLGIEDLKKDALYENLSWLCDQQTKIEQKLWNIRAQNKGSLPQLFLYDVTSSYLEGEQNALGAYGYNRDGKKSKQQIVIGLLTDDEGAPVAVRVFEGNTSDTKTVSDQVKALTQQFGIKEVTLVGDRGMLKTPQIQSLPDGFRYITAITKPMMQTLLEKEVIQLSLFDHEVQEVVHEKERYIFRRNPIREKEIQAARESKFELIRDYAEKKMQYLEQHPKAKVEVAQKHIQAKIDQLGVGAWVDLNVNTQNRTITLKRDEIALKEASFLDGCYVIKTDILEGVDAKTIHARYKDLSKVESAFRAMKTAQLELRPIYVRTQASTRGHVFIVMLAYLIAQALEKYWKEMDVTVQEGIDELGALSLIEVSDNQATCLKLPKPSSRAQKLIKLSNLILPEVLPKAKKIVPTKKRDQ